MALNKYNTIETLYNVCSQEKRTLTFKDKATATRYRLRIYNEKRKNKDLPNLTILLRDNQLIIGPAGFDLMEVFGEAMGEDTKEMMEREAMRKEKEHMDALQKRLDESAKRKRLQEMSARGELDPEFAAEWKRRGEEYGKKHPETQKEEQGTKEEFDPFAAYGEATEEEKKKGGN